MCRPSCCNNGGGQGAGIAAAAILAVTVAIAAIKIGHVVARIIHIAMELFRIVALTTLTVLAATVAAWLAIRATRWWLRHRGAQRHTEFRFITTEAPQHIEPEGTMTDCLGCGGSRTVLRAIGGSQYRAVACPVCEPAEKAG